MARAPQKRAFETRARLIAASEEIIGEAGFEALRVDEVVARAGTAKGTFFKHFKDKEALMDLIIGQRIDVFLDKLEAQDVPGTVEELVEALIPICEFMTCERYAFDIVLRYSGAAAIEEIGPIATTFGRLVGILIRWLTIAKFRDDISPEMQAEGVHSFMMQAMATEFCALHNVHSFRERLLPYLKAWLTPGK